jgi:hypothetical protein
MAEFYYYYYYYYLEFISKTPNNNNNNNNKILPSAQTGEFCDLVIYNIIGMTEID